MPYIESPIFGKSEVPDDNERAHIKELVDKFPVAMFQEINKKLNAKGLCLSIASKEEFH